MAPYQILKLELVAWFGLSKDAFHIFLGFAVFLIFAYFLKHKFNSFKLIIAPLVLGIVLEAMDFRDAFSYGLRINYMDSLQDIAITILCPLLLILFFRYIKKGE